MIFMSRLLSATGRGVGQQSELAGVLDRDRDVALVLHAVAGDPTRADLAAVGDELAEQRGVLVVDTGRLLLAELANLLLRLAHHCLGHCGAPFQRARLTPEWWLGLGYSVVRRGADQNGGSSELTPGVAHGSLAGAPPPAPPAGAPWPCAGVAHGSLSEGLACPPPCCPAPYDEPPERWVRVTLAVA